MKRLIFTAFLIIQTCISTYAYKYNATVTGANEAGTYNGLRLFIWETGSVNLAYPIRTFDTYGNYYAVFLFVNYNQNILINGTSSPNTFNRFDSYTFNPSDYIITNDFYIFSLNINGTYKNGFTGIDCEPVYIKMTSPSNETACSNQPHSIFINTIATTHWERSNDNGISWTNLVCTSGIYTESTPTAGTYLYRALNGDGTYSMIKQVTYQDAVPISVAVSPSTNTKTVDETITLVPYLSIWCIFWHNIQ